MRFEESTTVMSQGHGSAKKDRDEPWRSGWWVVAMGCGLTGTVLSIVGGAGPVKGAWAALGVALAAALGGGVWYWRKGDRKQLKEGRWLLLVLVVAVVNLALKHPDAFPL
ncbi:hypothetical protein ACWCV9_36635 [Streptomyces sp. NPDC001606]